MDLDDEDDIKEDNNEGPDAPPSWRLYTQCPE